MSILVELPNTFSVYDAENPVASNPEKLIVVAFELTKAPREKTEVVILSNTAIAKGLRAPVIAANGRPDKVCNEPVPITSIITLHSNVTDRPIFM
jgi:hypothetical protein